MRTEVPEFQGHLKPEEFIDWPCIAEEMMEFKRVLEEMKFPLIETRLQGRVVVRWRQFKLTRSQLGKTKVTT